MTERDDDIYVGSTTGKPAANIDGNKDNKSSGSSN